MTAPDPISIETMLAAGRQDPVPDEQTEEVARDLRMLFTACCHAGFTEDQALKIVGQAVASMVAGAVIAEAP